MTDPFPKGDPMSIAFLVWCWRRPLYAGLPLAILWVGIFIAVDVFRIVYHWLTQWGKE